MQVIRDVTSRCMAPRRNRYETASAFMLTWLILLIACAIMYLGWPPSARASDSASATSTPYSMASTPYPTITPPPYSGPPYIDRRDYTVAIERNGDVSVVEHWTIRINSMPNRLWLIMSTKQTTGIEFENVVGSGVHCSCPNRTGAYSTRAPNADIQWYFVASATQGSQTDDSQTQELRTYSFDIFYIVHGALGLNATRAWLDWQFLDTAGTINRLSSCTVSIALPASASPHTIQVAATDPDSALNTETVDGAVIVTSAASLDENNPFEVEMSFPRSLLSPSVKRSPWQKSDTPPTPPTSLGAPRAMLYFFVGYPHYPSDPPRPSPFQLLTPTSCMCGLVLIILLGVAPLARWRLDERVQRRAVPRWPRSPTPTSG